MRRHSTVTSKRGSGLEAKPTCGRNKVERAAKGRRLRSRGGPKLPRPLGHESHTTDADPLEAEVGDAAPEGGGGDRVGAQRVLLLRGQGPVLGRVAGGGAEG